MASGVLGLKIADRTFRFVHLEDTDTGLRLITAGAGLLPFTAKHRGQIRSSGGGDLARGLARALERAGVAGADCIVVLDGRSVQRTILWLPAELADGDELTDRVDRELRVRTGAGEGMLTCRHRVRGSVDGLVCIDAWGVWPEVQAGYVEAVAAAGCTVLDFDCDGWALLRLFPELPGTDGDGTTLVVHMEAEGLEIALIGAGGTAGATVPQGAARGGYERRWDPDDPGEVAAEIILWSERLTGRGAQPPIPPSRIVLTGSVEEPEHLLGALVTRTPARVEVLALQTFFTIDPELAGTPLLRSNLGSFALPVGGALAGFEG